LRCLECECLGRGNAEAVPKETAAPTKDIMELMGQLLTQHYEGSGCTELGCGCPGSQLHHLYESLQAEFRNRSICAHCNSSIEALPTAAAAPPTPDAAYREFEENNSRLLDHWYASVVATKAFMAGWRAREAASHLPGLTPALNEEERAAKLNELREAYEAGNLGWSEAIHLYEVWKRGVGPQGGEEKR